METHMRRIIFCLLTLCLLVPTVSARAEDCPAPKAWFSKTGTPVPSNAQPKRGNDCAFYQLAWQTFLYVTDQTNGSPRLLSYETYLDVFGADAKAGLLTSVDRRNRLLVLAPRLLKTAQSVDAEDIDQAGSNAVLIDQNGHVVFYNILLNPAFSKFVRTSKLNDLPTLLAAKPNKELPVGVVEFKAAWQIVDASNPPKDRIVVQAKVPVLTGNGSGKLVVDKSKPLRPVTVALIGLHVVMRPEGHPEMIWATFEYDRNAPSTAGNPTDPNANCPNPSEVRDDSVRNDGQPYLLSAADTAVGINRKPTSITIKDADNQIFEPTPKTSIVRVFPFSACSPARDDRQAIKEIDPAIVALNQSAKSQIVDPTRKSFSLIGAVWLDEPANPNDNRGFRENRTFEDFELGGENRLSSASMESFTQVGSPNCFSCHDTNAKGNLGPTRLSVSHIFRRFSLSKK
jgi:hypothetical protein